MMHTATRSRSRPNQPRSSDCELIEGAVSVMYITEMAGRAVLNVCLGKVKSDALSNQLITFTRCLREALPIKYRDLPSAGLDQARTFQLADGIRDGWPMDTQHFGEQVLCDRQRVIVTAVTHHQQSTRQPLLEAVRTVARYGHHDLFEKGLDVSVHDTAEGRH